MNCLEVRYINPKQVIQHFHFNDETDLKTFQKKILINVYKDLICDDVDKRIDTTKQLFKPSCNVKKYGIENTDVFDTYVWKN
jgi:DNA recombination-dependent growth factor C